MFKRLNPPGTPPSEMVSPKLANLGLGMRERIVQSAISSGFIKFRPDNSYSDSELIKYTCVAGNREWFGWLLKNCDLFNSRGNVRKELRKDFEEALRHAVESGSVEMASRLFELGSKMKGTIHSALYRAIRQGRHEMAELLFAKGGEIRQYHKLNECIHYADDRMRKIIEKGMMESISRRFR